MTKEKGRPAKGGQKTYPAISIPLSSVISSQALGFARKTHCANPRQTTTAIFDFQRDVWEQVVDEAVSEAQLFYMLETGAER